MSTSVIFDLQSRILHRTVWKFMTYLQVKLRMPSCTRISIITKLLAGPNQSPFALRRNVQTGSGFYPASISMGTGDNAAGVWSSSLTSTRSEVKKYVELYLHFSIFLHGAHMDCNLSYCVFLRSCHFFFTLYKNRVRKLGLVIPYS
jgi:hypothetical protein